MLPVTQKINPADRFYKLGIKIHPSFKTNPGV